MTPSTARPAEPRRRTVQWFFRDPRTGEVALYQRPNRAMKLAGSLDVTTRVLRAAHVMERESPLDVFLERATTVVFLWWAADELLRGTSPYRRTVGGVSLVLGVARAVRAERSRRTATAT